jgi:hydrogenase maturation protease
MKKNRSVLILGIGNILQSDDGLGIHIVNHITQNIELPDDAEAIDGGTAGFDLIPLLTGREKIIIVDALRVDDEPGSIYRFKPEDASKSRASLSLHEVGIIEVIDMLRLLGENPQIEIIGIVPEDLDTLNMNISPSVRRSIPDAIIQIMDAVTN